MFVETLYLAFSRQLWCSQAVRQTEKQGGPIALLIGAGKRLQSSAYDGNAPLILPPSLHHNAVRWKAAFPDGHAGEERSKKWVLSALKLF